jgi:hypothetical protein
MVFWRSRGGELTEVDEADQFIVDGDYFTARRPASSARRTARSRATTRLAWRGAGATA